VPARRDILGLRLCQHLFTKAPVRKYCLSVEDHPKAYKSDGDVLYSNEIDEGVAADEGRCRLTEARALPSEWVVMQFPFQPSLLAILRGRG
jgi:hypothetical protein